MPPLLQRKSEAAPPVLPAWHPNFRIANKLPDTKVVRTAFFVNAIAVTVTLIAALFCVFQESQIRTEQGRIIVADQNIARDRVGSAQAVSLYGKFKAEQAKEEEVRDFVNSGPLPSEILLRIGQTLPKKVAIDSFEFRSTGVVLHGTVKGAADKASGDASAYESQLRRDKVLSQYFSDVRITGIDRDRLTGRLVVEIVMGFKKGIRPKS